MVFLVVDDMEGNRELLAFYLDRAGHLPVKAANGHEALAIVRQRPIGAVISDMVMPGMNGCQLCLSIRRIPGLKNLPFLLYTMAYDSINADDRVALARANAIVVMPPTFDMLLRLVKSLSANT